MLDPGILISKFRQPFCANIGFWKPSFVLQIYSFSSGPVLSSSPDLLRRTQICLPRTPMCLRRTQVCFFFRPLITVWNNTVQFKGSFLGSSDRNDTYVKRLVLVFERHQVEKWGADWVEWGIKGLPHDRIHQGPATVPFGIWAVAVHCRCHRCESKPQVQRSWLCMGCFWETPACVTRGHCIRSQKTDDAHDRRAPFARSEIQTTKESKEPHGGNCGQENFQPYHSASNISETQTR